MKLEDCSSLSYFLKVTQNDQGLAMVSGEFVSMSTLYAALEYLTPKPIATGTYAANANIHFFFLAELHRNGLSPNGKYGFSVPTLQGTIPQYTEWKETWEEFFYNSIKIVMDNEERSQGHDPEVRALCDAVLEKVVPRLLRPLETGGRQIQPRLVHGDIWDGNVSTDTDTDTPVIFDATCIYGHNESE
ncbi:MAG: hypothetical protein M1828_006009 [Chrysothrix sp. TS-e1954]|nr:MAG: hypothetical protein M1828_006009 [Chrysothrix sp. TS-e1954]